MDDYTKTLILLSDGNFDSDQLVQLFELTLSNIEINTIQGMADSEGKSYNGIKNSNRYKKFKIGKQTLVAKGVRQNSLPF